MCTPAYAVCVFMCVLCMFAGVYVYVCLLVCACMFASVCVCACTLAIKQGHDCRVYVNHL